MERRTADKRTRVTNPEAAAAELAEHYARILGQQADRRVSAVIRTCLSRIPSRLPIQGEDLHAVEELVGRVLRLGEVGARDPVGSPRQIDDYIAGRLGEPASGPRSVYRALRAMVGRTALVERLSRQIYVLRLAELLDPSSKVHRALLAETPALYSLPASDTEADDLHTPPQLVEPLTADSSQHLRLEVARLQEELAAERLARAEVDRRRVAAEAALEAEHRARGEADQQVQVAAARLTTLEQELRRLRGAIDEFRGARDEEGRRGASTAQLTALEQELGASRGREQVLADSLADAQRELGTLHRVLEQERRAREEAELLVQAAAAHRATLEQDLDLLRYALDEERLARADADKRGQVVEAELVAMQDAHAVDVATTRRLLACDQAIGAAAFLIARMHGVNHEDAIKAVHPLMPAAAAALLAAGDQTPEADPTGGPPAAPAAVDTAPLSPADLPMTSDTPTIGPHRAAPPPSAAMQDTAPRTPPPQRPRASRVLGFLAPGTDLDPLPRQFDKVGRNDPCPCGSGTKFKRCCGRSA